MNSDFKLFLFQGLSHYLKREIQIINAQTGHVTVFEPSVYDDQKGPMICVRSGAHYQVPMQIYHIIATRGVTGGWAGWAIALQFFAE